MTSANEVQPRERDDFAYTESKLGELVSSVRAADAQRVLLYSCDLNWAETTASLGLAVGCHAYYPKYIATTGYEYAEQNPLRRSFLAPALVPYGQWYRTVFVPLIIQGDLSEAELSLHVDGLEGTEILVQANGEAVETLVISGGTSSEDGNTHYQGLLPAITLPQGTTESGDPGLGGRLRHDGYDHDQRYHGGKWSWYPTTPWTTPDRSEPLPLIVLDDGTYTNSENRMIDSAEIYQADVKPYQDIAAQYGVGFMVNEFGIFWLQCGLGHQCCRWPITTTVLQMLTEQNIGWCYCELYNPISKHLVLMPAGGVTEFLSGAIPPRKP